jgi:hypothetical protein
MSPVIPRNFVPIAETSAKIFSFGAIGMMNSVIHAMREDQTFSPKAKSLITIGNCRETSAKIFSFVGDRIC